MKRITKLSIVIGSSLLLLLAFITVGSETFGGPVLNMPQLVQLQSESAPHLRFNEISVWNPSDNGDRDYFFWRTQMAWGDVDGDGDYDLALGTANRDAFESIEVPPPFPIKLYRNNSGKMEETAFWESAETFESVQALEWGDVDGDGDLDLAVTAEDENENTSLLIYANQNGLLEKSAEWETVDVKRLFLSWIDADLDGDLDLSLGTNLYVNEDGILAAEPIPLVPDLSRPQNLEWADLNGDRFPDFAIIEQIDPLSDEFIFGDSVAEPNFFVNDGSGNYIPVFDTITAPNLADRLNQDDWALEISPIFADIDNDGLEDRITFEGIYLQTDGAFGESPDILLPEGNTSRTVVDFDNDGDLDLALGSGEKRLVLLENLSVPFQDRFKTQLLSHPDDEFISANSYAFIDIDQDLDLDFINLRSGEGEVWFDPADNEVELRVYENRNGRLSQTPDVLWSAIGSEFHMDWADIDLDGDMDVALANGRAFRPPLLSGQGNPDLIYESPQTPRQLILLNQNGVLELVWETTDPITSTGSVHWIDVNGDQAPDLFLGAEEGISRLYLNKNGTIDENPDWTSSTAEAVYGIASGDLDGDGDHDLGIGVQMGGQEDQSGLQFINNQGGELAASAAYGNNRPTSSFDIDLGDFDQDGDLDLATSEYDKVRVYENVDGVINEEPVWEWSTEEGFLFGEVNWVDVDGDRDLDLYIDAMTLFINQNGQLEQTPRWVADDVGYFEHNDATSGDVDGDGDPDLIFKDSLFQNERQTDERFLAGQSSVQLFEDELSVDGSIISIPFVIQNGADLTTGQVKGFYSIGGGEWQEAIPAADFAPYHLASIGGPYTDLVSQFKFDEGSDGLLYDSFGSFESEFFGEATFVSDSPHSLPYSQFSLEFTEQNGFAELQLAEGFNSDQFSFGLWVKPDGNSQAFSTILTTDLLELSIFPDGQLSLTVFDTDCSDILDSIESDLFLEPDQWQHLLISGDNQVYKLYVDGQLAGEMSLGKSTCLDPESILFLGDNFEEDAPFSGRVDDFRVYRSALNPAEVEQLATPAAPYVYRWDTFASGFFGASDEVIFRLEAIPQPPSTNPAEPGTYRYTGANFKPNQPLAPAYDESRPLPVRGTQIRVVDEAGTPLPNAIVFQQNESQSTLAPIQSEITGEPFLTDLQGYLQGRGELSSGDQLVALFPITGTTNSVIYLTSGMPTETGVETVEVGAGGVQTLTVSAENHLVLFDLSISLEWDARNDTAYLEQLNTAVERTSQVLYDATDGQAAISLVEIYHNKGRWSEADIVIKASNQTRPVAVLGGSVFTPTTRFLTPDSAIADEVGNADGLIETVYLPGQITMPPRWSPFGGGQGEMGEDWARVLAHELGHYLFGIPDNYLGVDDELNFKLVDCPTSLMDNPYLEQGSEFRVNDASWEAECGDTMQDQYFGRSDWDTITAEYPMLRPPSEANGINPGPNRLPLDLTRIQYFAPPIGTQTLDNHFFPLQTAEGNPIFVQGGKLSAYLLKNVDNPEPDDDYIVELGTTIPSGSGIEAWGAEPGDQLCTVDRSVEPPRFGCVDRIQNFSEPLILNPVTDWQPEIELVTVSTTTVQLTVTGLSEIQSPLIAQLITPVGDSSAKKVISPNGEGEFTTELETASGAFYGHIWLEADMLGGSGQLVSAQTLIPFQSVLDWSGNEIDWGGKQTLWDGKQTLWDGKQTTWDGKQTLWDGKQTTWDGKQTLWDGKQTTWDGKQTLWDGKQTLWDGKQTTWDGKGIGWGGKGISWGAPSKSEDAQVAMYPLKNIFGASVEFSLYQIDTAADLPGYLTQVGQAYQVDSLNQLPEKAAITFNYLTRDILGGANNEQFLAIYYRPAGETVWQPVETEVDVQRNIAIADLPGDGSFVLAMAQPLGPLEGGQLNLLTWPLKRTLPVEEALSAIEGKYSGLYRFDTAQESWQFIDDETTPPEITVDEMSFGSYWIWMDESVDQLFAPVDFIETDP